MIKFSELPAICGGTIAQLSEDREISTLIIDSRKAIVSEKALFFAIKGERNDGHIFIPALYASGFRQFVVEEVTSTRKFPLASFLVVNSAVHALQKIAAFHRSSFSLPVIGITGSNGKTIIKEWLYQLLSIDKNIIKNPGSYNSQVGVPLSVWQIQSHHALGIFEAGVSRVGEMENLRAIIEPTIGIFTTLGSAHAEGFENDVQKIREKILLFRKADCIIYCKDQVAVADEIEIAGTQTQKLIGWGSSSSSDVVIARQSGNDYKVSGLSQDFQLRFPFSDAASIENACHCIVTMLYLKCATTAIQERIGQLKSVPMRLELKQGINGCQIIDDTYNNDLAGLQISLNFLAGMQKKKSTLILSDIHQSGWNDEILAQRIFEVVSQARINLLIGIGKGLRSQGDYFKERMPSLFFESTEDFLSRFNFSDFHQEVILVKGARTFKFEKIIHQLQKKVHGTVMEIDLGAMVHNLNFFRSRINPGVKIMAMVKAFAYGSGSEEVANLLQYHSIDYLGVAYADEGIELRKNQIRLPIMVMNPSESSFETMLSHSLEPEIFSLAMLKRFVEFLNGRPSKIHLKIDTGMHRLGFEEKDLPEVIQFLKDNSEMKVVSIFSHLAGADEPQHDLFTRQQAEYFVRLCDQVKKALLIDPVLHILNSSGILRFPEFQLGMVRLGIGLYGVDPTTERAAQLQPVATLKTVISQIKKITAGESIGYGRKGIAGKETKIATLAIGYADGFSRSFSRGKGAVYINGKLAPVIGNVCMDMTMVDVTDIDVAEGDEAIIFGKELPIQEVAKTIDTIPYEILTGTSERVKRVFYSESI